MENFLKNCATSAPIRTLTRYIQISPSQGDPAHRKVSRVTFFGAPAAADRAREAHTWRVSPRTPTRGPATDPEIGGLPNATPAQVNYRFSALFFDPTRFVAPQNRLAHHLPIHRKSIPFPGNPGSLKGGSGCFFIRGFPHILPPICLRLKPGVHFLARRPKGLGRASNEPTSRAALKLLSDQFF